MAMLKVFQKYFLENLSLFQWNSHDIILHDYNIMALQVLMYLRVKFSNVGHNH